MEDEQKPTPFTFANVLINFLVMVLAVCSSLVVMVFFVLDAKYVQTESYDVDLGTIHASIDDLKDVVKDQDTERKVSEAQFHRDILNAKEDSLEFKQKMISMQSDVAETKRNVAVLLDRTKP